MKIRIISSVFFASSTIYSVLATENTEVLDKTMQDVISLETDASRDLALEYPREDPDSSVQSKSGGCDTNYQEEYINKIWPDGTVKTKTCSWLSKRPRLHHAKCTMQSQSINGFSVAKDTCHTICEQFDQYLLEVNADLSYTSRSCFWLFKYQHYYLADHCARDFQGIDGLLPAKYTCRLLCRTCSIDERTPAPTTNPTKTPAPTINPTTNPTTTSSPTVTCEESGKYLIRVEANGDAVTKPCRWLRTAATEEVKNRHCSKTLSAQGFDPARIACPRTCKTCSSNAPSVIPTQQPSSSPDASSCTEGETDRYLVYVDHRNKYIKTRTCGWLSRRPEKKTIHCDKTESFQAFHPASVVCPDTCNGKSCH